MLNFAVMKQFAVIMLIAAALLSCGGKRPRAEVFAIECVNKTTPVKNQGRGPLCWIYAMLATIESDRLMIGDSVNLSAAYIARAVLMEQTERCYLTRGSIKPSLRGTAPAAVAAVARFGAMPFDVCRTDADFNVAVRRMTRLAESCAARRTGLERLRSRAADMLDETLVSVPKRVYMLGAEYSCGEFGRSVCKAGEYVSLTSFTHKPFYENIVLDVPDNRCGRRFLNVPADTLVNAMERALRSGRSVCWEGDISEAGFSFTKGVARLDDEQAAVTQAARQRAFETFATTDDHCMEITGIARDCRGGRYFICKNSWGTANPYGGMMFMSFNYARLKTVAVVMKMDENERKRYEKQI